MRLALIFICLLSTAKAGCQYQDTINLKILESNEVSLHLPRGSSSYYLYKIGDDEFEPIGKRGKKIQPFLLSQPSSKAEWKRSRRNSTLSFISSLISFTGFWFAVFESTDAKIGNDNTIRNIGLGTGIVFQSTSIIFKKKSHKQFRKAVKNYNGAAN